MSTKQSQQTDAGDAKATSILTVIVYLVWNYLLHLTYWHFEDSWLHYYVKHGNYIKLYGIHILHAFTVLIYLFAALRSPGYVSINERSTEVNSPKYCPICKIIRPRRSKHCYSCQKCIVKYDHHCIFTGNCVGASNHRFFVFYLTIQFLFLCWSFPLSIDSIYYSFTNFNDVGYIQSLYRFGCFLGISFAFIGVSLLFLLHIYLIITNQTTYIVLKKYNLCGKKKKGSYDSKHFDPDIDETENSILLNIMRFIANPVPEEWKMGKIHDDITPKDQWLSNEDVLKKSYMQNSGVGCVPLPSFNAKQD